MEQKLVWSIVAHIENNHGISKSEHLGGVKHIHEVGRVLTTYKPPRNYRVVKFETYEAFIWE